MYTRLTRSCTRAELAFPAYRGVRNYLNYYFAIYKRLKRSRVRVERASPA